MNSDDAVEQFDGTDQYLTTTDLSADQLQLAIFKGTDKTAFPMGLEIFFLPVVPLLRSLFICQRFLVMPRDVRVSR